MEGLLAKLKLHVSARMEFVLMAFKAFEKGEAIDPEVLKAHESQHSELVEMHAKLSNWITYPPDANVDSLSYQGIERAAARLIGYLSEVMKNKENSENAKYEITRAHSNFEDAILKFQMEQTSPLSSIVDVNQDLQRNLTRGKLQFDPAFGEKLSSIVPMLSSHQSRGNIQYQPSTNVNTASHSIPPVPSSLPSKVLSGNASKRLSIFTSASVPPTQLPPLPYTDSRLSTTSSTMLSVTNQQCAVELSNLIKSEKMYLDALNTFQEIYSLPFSQQHTRFKKLVTEPELSAYQSLLTHLCTFVKFHSQFYQQLKTYENDSDRFIQVLPQIITELKIYTNYLTHLDRNLELLRKSLKNRDFLKFIEDCKMSHGKGSFDIEWILSLPSNRFKDYHSFLIKLQNIIPTTDSCYYSIIASIDQIQNITKLVEQSRDTINNQNKIIFLQAHVAGIPQEITLLAPHRSLLHQRSGLEIKVNNEGKKIRLANVNVYAFNDMMLVTKNKGFMSKEEVNELILSYHDCQVELDNEEKHAIRFQHNRATYTLCLNDAELRATWHRDILAAIETLKGSRVTNISNVVKVVDTDMALFQITIIAGRELSPNVLDPVDCFVRIKLNDNVCQTVCIQDCRFCAIWNEEFVLVSKTPNTDFVTIELRDQRHQDVDLGQIVISLNEFYYNVKKRNWYMFKPVDPSAMNQPQLLIEMVMGEKIDK